MKIAIMADTHGNVPAFMKSMNLIHSLGIDKIYHLGDLLGYFPSLEILDVIKQSDFEIICTKGNHEKLIYENKIDKLKDEIYKHSFLRSQMNESQLQDINNYPTYVEVMTKRGLAHLSHGGPDNPVEGYIYFEDAQNYSANEYRYIFCGNTHRSYLYIGRKTTIVNVGSCGLPRDNGNKGSFVTFDLESLEIVIHRVEIPNMHIELSEVERKQVHPSVLNNYYRRENPVTNKI